MKVLISSMEAPALEIEANVSDLNYDQEKGYFWMRCVMGDDWLQRVTSSLSCPPRIVRTTDKVMFVLFDHECDSGRFAVWLDEAQAAVDYGYRTMRG